MMESASDYYDVMNHYDLLTRVCEFTLGHTSAEKMATTNEGRKAVLRLRSRINSPRYSVESAMPDIERCFKEATQRINWLEEIRDNISGLSSDEIIREMLLVLPISEITLYNNLGIIMKYEHPRDMGDEYLKSLLRRYLDYAIDKSKPILSRVRQG